MSRLLQGRKVLALGTGVTVLGVLRILHADGAEAFALPPSDVDPLVRRCRWYRPGPAALKGVTPDTLAGALDGLPEGTVLLPCSDAWVKAVGSLPRSAAARFPSAVPLPGAVDTLINKELLAAALDRLGLPGPLTVAPITALSLAAIPEERLVGAFLKPAHSQQFFARFGVKAFRVSGRAEAAARLAQCTEAGLPMMLQEYVPGPASSHYYIEGFLDRTGVARAWFARRRLRMYPPDFGNSTLMVSVPMEEVRDGRHALEVLLSDLRYRGIFSAEFKRDERTGRFVLIEVNARPWWYVEFAARCGVDVCALYVLDALGERVPQVDRYAVGRRCVYPYYDLEAARAEWKSGRLSLLSWARTWIGSWQPVFRWSDPVPALGFAFDALVRRVR